MESQSKLIPLATARKTRFRRPNGKPADPSTTWRWARKGIQGVDGERIKLQIVYVGNTPHVSETAINDFVERVTAAKLERHRRAEELAADVSDAELESAGLA